MKEITYLNERDPHVLGYCGISVIVAETGCGTRNLYQVAEVADEINRGMFIAEGLLFEFSTVGFVLYKYMPHFLVCASESQAIRSEICVECLVTHFICSNCSYN